jgi:transcriptional regulator
MTQDPGMYVPRHFALGDRAELVALMRAHAFATVVTAQGGAPFASHLPVLVEERGEALVIGAHVARANPQWRQLAGETLCIFHGPHAYVSPAWYAEDPPDTRVPTWNYAAVHAAGRARLLGEAGTVRLLEALVAEHEAGRAPPWRVDLQVAPRRRLLQGIVGFEVEVTRVEGKLKLSQNRAPADRRRVQAALASSPHAGDREVARLMERHVPGAAPDDDQADGQG